MRDGETLVGFALQRDDRFYFFGSGMLKREDLHRLFPRFEFCFLKQIHGREVVEADPENSAEADGHFTSVPYRALVSQSADCVPILLSTPTHVCAIHAGWKGMSLNILGVAKDKLPDFNFAAIGPHIMKQSFEVGLDVAEQLRQASPKADGSLISPSANSEKVFFDLKRLSELQLSQPGLTFEDCCFDTKTDTRFHSYRRGRATPERQYSFVVIADNLR